MRRRTVQTIAGPAVLAAALTGAVLTPAGAAQAAGGTNLLANGTFDSGSTSGWKTTNAALSLASPGFGGTADAVKVSLSGTTTSYNIYAAPKPATAVPAGEQFQGTAQVSGTTGRSMCLLLQEKTSGGTLVKTAKQCVTATGSWQAIGPLNLTDQNSGDSVGYIISQSGAQAGDSFLADSLSIVDVDTTAPSAPSGLTATAASANEIDLSWSAASDPDYGGLHGYAIYRDGGSAPIATTSATVTTYKDTSVSAGSTHTYQVAAFDYAKNYSAPSNQASATTSSAPLAAQWHMNETSGTTMVDSSGNGNNGTLHSVTLGAVGCSGTAYTFNRSYAEVPDAPSLNPGSANIDISFCLATTSLPTSGDYDLVRKGTASTQEYKIELLQSGQISCVFRGSTNHFNATGGSGLTDGAWHHIDCIKTSTQVQLVIDGSAVKTTTGAVGSISNTTAVEIGAYPGSDWYKGQLDEVSLAFG